MPTQSPQVTPEIQAKIDTLTELFPDWTADDLLELVQEYDDVETVIDKITSGAVSKWGRVTGKRETKREKDKSSKNAGNESNQSQGDGTMATSASTSMSMQQPVKEQRAVKQDTKPIRTKAVSQTSSWATAISTDMEEPQVNTKGSGKSSEESLSEIKKSDNMADSLGDNEEKTLTKDNTDAKEFRLPTDKNVDLAQKSNEQSSPAISGSLRPVQEPTHALNQSTFESTQQQPYSQHGIYQNQRSRDTGHSFSMFDTARNQSQQQFQAYQEYTNPQFEQHQYLGIQDRHLPLGSKGYPDRSQGQNHNQNQQVNDTNTIRQYQGMLSAAYPTFHQDSQPSATSDQQQEQQQYMQYYQQYYGDPFALSQQGFGTVKSGSIAFTRGFGSYQSPNNGYHYSQNLRAREITSGDGQQSQQVQQQGEWTQQQSPNRQYQQQQQGLDSTGQPQDKNSGGNRGNGGFGSYSFNMSSQASRGFY